MWGSCALSGMGVYGVYWMHPTLCEGESGSGWVSASVSVCVHGSACGVHVWVNVCGMK